MYYSVMERVLVNKVGKTQRRKLCGRECAVAPMTMIVPGVLNGSEGPYFYPAEENTKSVAAWNGMPIVLDHPTKDGKPISARSPEVLEKYGMGTVYEAGVNNDGHLEAEAWFDVENTNRVKPGLLAKIEAGEKVELSTGLGVGRDETQGVHNGVSYKGIAREHKPDHLAVLVGKKGACSVRDGCGINNEEKTSIWQKLGELLGVATKPVANLESDMEKKTLVEFLTANCDCWKGDAATLNTFSEEKLSKLKASHDAKVQLTEQVATLTANSGKKETPQPLNLDELAEKLAPKLSALVANTVKAEADKKPLVARLLANVKAEERAAKEAMLNGKSVAELQDIVSLMPPSRDLYPPTGATYLPGGGYTPPVTNEAEDEADVVAMTPPVINYGKTA